MPSSIAFPEWLNANSLRSYPLAENSSLTSDSGAVTIPTSLIVDARFGMPFSMAEGEVYVSMVESLPDGVTVTLSYDDGSSTSLLATIVADAATHTRNKSYPFVGAGENQAVLGNLTLGEIEDTIGQFRGRHTFAAGAAPFSLSVMNVSQPMVEYISFIDSGVEVARISDYLKLKAGSNIRLTRVAADTIRVDGISGENLDDCPGETPQPILTVNGVPGDEAQNLELSGSECIAVAAGGANTLKIHDLCASACCGCDELDSLIGSQESVEAQVSQLRDLIYQAYSDHSAMIATMTAYMRP